MNKRLFEKKVRKRFVNFTEEEQWLNSMIQDGWVLQYYNSNYRDNETTYFFDAIKEDSQKKWVYKIDYRELAKKKVKEFHALFAESGLTPIANKQFFKHIFYTHSDNPNIDTFTDSKFIKDREQRRMKPCLISFVTYMLAMVIFMALAFYLDDDFLDIGALVMLSFAVQSLWMYAKYRKNNKLLV